MCLWLIISVIQSLGAACSCLTNFIAAVGSLPPPPLMFVQLPAAVTHFTKGPPIQSWDGQWGSQRSVRGIRLHCQRKAICCCWWEDVCFFSSSCVSLWKGFFVSVVRQQSLPFHITQAEVRLCHSFSFWLFCSAPNRYCWTFFLSLERFPFKSFLFFCLSPCSEKSWANCSDCYQEV